MTRHTCHQCDSTGDLRRVAVDQRGSGTGWHWQTLCGRCLDRVTRTGRSTLSVGRVRA